MARPRGKAEARQATRPRSARWKWILAGLVGVAVHVVAVQFSPRYGYFLDHDDFIRWSIQATDEGLLTLYDHPPPRWPSRKFVEGQGWITDPRPADRLCNYPPLATYVFWVNGVVFKSVDPDRLINTRASRGVLAAWGILAAVVMALGCAALVRELAPGRGELLAFVLTLLAPPLVWDTAIWVQTETWVLAPAVWMVWAMIRGRWWLAGLLWGVIFGLKPQAILFAPAWLMALVVARTRWRPLAGMGLGGVVFFAAALPFTLHSGLAWWRESYQKNLLEAYPDTTLRAFNIWYVDLLLCENRDSSVKLLGLQKDAWGKVLLATALLGLGAAVWRRWGGDRQALLYWTVLALLAFVTLPTRVHERYVVLIFPFAIACAMLRRRVWLGVAPLLVAATVQLTWQHWLATAPENWKGIVERSRLAYQRYVSSLPPENRAEVAGFDQFLKQRRRAFDEKRSQSAGLEWSATLLALGGSVATAVGLLSRRPAPKGHDAEKPRRQRRRKRHRR